MTIANTNKRTGAIDVIKLARDVADEGTSDPFHNDYITLSPKELQAFANAVLDAAAEQCETSPDCLYAANAIREMKK